MALINIENDDPWLLEYDACERLFREIMEQFTLRERESRMSQAFAALSANIRLQMTQYTQKISQLKSKVKDALRLRTITVEEAERRLRQVEQLQSKDVQLHQLYNSHTTVLVNSRADLFKTGSSAFVDAGTTSWAMDDDEPLIDIHVSATDLKQHQEQVLQEQEKGLEELCKVIARQKQIGQAISNEVEYQNEIIDDLADHMERTDESLINKTRQVQNIGKKDRTCGYWMVIIVLFVSILVVAAV